MSSECKSTTSLYWNRLKNLSHFKRMKIPMKIQIELKNKVKLAEMFFITSVNSLLIHYVCKNEEMKLILTTTNGFH